MTPDYQAFGTLKELYLKSPNEEKPEIFEKMRENLIKRNDGDTLINLYYPKGQSIDLSTVTNHEELFMAHNTLGTCGK